MSKGTRVTTIPFSYPTFLLAKQYIDAFNHLKKDSELYLPSIVNAAFAVELALKSYSGGYELVDENLVNHGYFQSSRGVSQRVLRHPAAKGHKLSELYCLIPEGSKQALEDTWDSHSTGIPLLEYFEMINDDFIKARYIDEGGSITSEISLYETLFEVFLATEEDIFS